MGRVHGLLSLFCVPSNADAADIVERCAQGARIAVNRDAEIARQRERLERDYASRRRHAWAEIRRMGAEQVVRDVVGVFGKLGGLPTVTWRKRT